MGKRRRRNKNKSQSQSGDPPVKKRRLRSNTDGVHESLPDDDVSVPSTWPEYIESDQEEINLADSDLEISDDSAPNSPKNTPADQEQPKPEVAEGTEVKQEDAFMVEDMSPSDNRWININSDDDNDGGDEASEDVEIHPAEEGDETQNFVCDSCSSLIFDLRWSCRDCQNHYDLCDLCYNQQHLPDDPEAEHKEDHVMAAYEVRDPEMFEDDDNDSVGDKNTDEFFYSDDDSAEEEGEEEPASFEDHSFLEEFSQPESIRDLSWDQRLSYLLEEAVQDQGIQSTAFLISQFNTVFSGRLFMDDLRSYLFSQPGKAHLEPLVESIICLPGGGPGNSSAFQIVAADGDIEVTCNYLPDGHQIEFQPPTVTISTDEGCQELLRAAALPEMPPADVVWLFNTLFTYVPSYLRAEHTTEDADTVTEDSPPSSAQVHTNDDTVMDEGTAKEDAPPETTSPQALDFHN